MSRKHGHRRKRQRKAARKRASSARAKLDAVADALNACDRAGLAPRVVQGAVMTRAGYVLFLPVKGQKRERWSARALALDPLSPADDGPDD